MSALTRLLWFSSITGKADPCLAIASVGHGNGAGNRSFPRDKERIAALYACVKSGAGSGVCARNTQ